MRALLALGLAADLFVLRSVLVGREAFLYRFARWATPIAAVELVAAVAALVHLVVVLRSPKYVARRGARGSDDRVLLVASASFAAGYLFAHLALGPLGVLVRSGDAFTLYATMVDGYPKYLLAATNAIGLVAVGLHGFELAARSEPTERRARRGAIAVAAAIVYAALALDPIALLTTGRPLFSRRSGPQVMTTDNSATVPAR